MDFYIFSSKIDETKELIDHHYSGALFVYLTFVNDFFTQIARTIDLKENFKYMVAIRPYAISPQYLCMINNSINKIDKNRLEINFISGNSHEIIEKESGGILGDVHDSSSKNEKSNYLIKYVETLEKIDKEIPKYYISVANSSMVDETLKYDSNLLINHIDYKNNIYNLENRKVMIYSWLVLRETKQELDAVPKLNSESNPLYNKIEYLTYQEFDQIIKKLENQGINKMLLYCNWNEEDRKIINKFVKQYKESRNNDGILSI